MQEAHGGGDDEIGTGVAIDGQRGQHWGQQGHRETQIRDDAEEAAEGADEKRVGQLHQDEKDGAEEAEDETEHEIAGHVGPGHAGNGVPAARGDVFRLALKQPQKSAAHVIAPTEHEVDQEGNEGKHQQRVVVTRDGTIEQQENIGPGLVKADFLDTGGGGGRLWRAAAADAVGRLGGRDRTRRTGGGIGGRMGTGLLQTARQNLGDGPFKAFHAIADAIHQGVHFETVLRQILHQLGDLREGGQGQQVDA